jgi:hypothetical protein
MTGKSLFAGKIRSLAQVLLAIALSYPLRTAPQQLRRALEIQDVQDCDDVLCTYLVFVHPQYAGPDAEQRIKSVAGDDFVELAQAETYSGSRSNH